MAGSAAHRGAEAPLAWRGSEPPDDDWLAPADDHPDDDDLFAAGTARRRRLRSAALLGVGGLVLAAVVVTGVGTTEPDDPTRADEAVPTTVAGEEADADDPTGATAADLRADGSSTVDPDVAAAIEGGLRWGGAGGGADIRLDRPPPVAIPLVDTSGLPRLPASVDTTRWSTVLAPTEAGGSPRLHVAVGGDTAYVLVRVGESARLHSLSMEDGSAAWSVAVDGAPVGLGPATDEVVAVRNAGAEGTTVRWLSAVDGAESPPDAAAVRRAVAAADAADPAVALDPAVLTERPIEVAAGLSGRALAAAESVADGTASVLALDLVARDRAVAFVGRALVGIRLPGPADADGDLSVDGPLVADWARAGVMLFAGPSERGATLLVSNVRGNQQQVVDAASGRTIAELSWPAAPATGFVATVDGVLLPQPGLIGRVLVAVGLDGAQRWQLVGSPEFAVGDGVVVTAEVGDAGVVVAARS